MEALAEPEDYEIPDKREKLLNNLSVAANRLAARREKIVERFGISGSWLNVLRVLKDQHPEPCNARLIKKHIVGQNPDISRIVARLLKAGLVCQKKSKSDHRVYDITLSFSGEIVMKSLDAEKEEVLQPINVFSAEEIYYLNNLLEELLQKLAA